ncbi:flagellar protein export ATPase FliI [Sporolactobacillus inulinus]|jgi:flagellum-specific ATP synthase|uniref:ATP synthase n=1 Tax=Sporolactobacillus inulinus CASD TaxID=1069536 RepID=A0A0U1QLZ7_9BACL|nr:flagellar protein export ATPase FliI [Sporolactobacillus inulinus]KLI01821.1 ATP synthase [Sporolactobacillus inulinus CASD]GEB75897.1 flagellum-specific ATP synthase [Sporolactobacillus inulinus]
MNADTLIEHLADIDSYRRYGKIHRVVGLLIESKGPSASVGDVCLIHIKSGKKVLAEVVGFKGENILLMPFTSVATIAPGCLVEATGKPLEVKVNEELIGQVCDSLGRPLSDMHFTKPFDRVTTNQSPPNPMTRPRISEPIELGVRSINGLLTVGRGQRIGIFAGSGVGKSTLMGMVARNTSADLNVIALIGERGREVREFLEKDLGPEGMKRSIIIVATSDQPALMRIKGAFTATSIAEYFRSKGKDVLLMMDSLTRVAMSQRELGLAVGEPPTTKGYPPSVFAMLPELLERTGTDAHGTITALYTVLVDGDDLDEPVSDTARGILDGHIVLDRALAQKGQYPAINLLKSVSRVMNEICTPEHLKAAQHFRALLAQYTESEDLIAIGAYKPGSSASIDEAIHFHPKLISYLRQSENIGVSLHESIKQLIADFGQEVEDNGV